MQNELLIAILSFAGTSVGALGGILAANRLSNYRIEQLENQVKKHNNLIERMFNLEAKVDVLEEKQDVANHRISDLEASTEKNREKIINMQGANK
jgi:hypothetical protein